MSNKLVPFTLVQVRYFVEIARRENMTAAADALWVTQPTLSAAIKQLEELFHAKLFLRTENNRLKLTSDGRSILSYAERLIYAAKELSEHAKNPGGELSGELVVGVFSPIAPFHIPRILRMFSEIYPRISLSFVDGNQSTLQQMIHRGVCDIAIMYRLDLDPHIDAKVVDYVSPYVLLPETHSLASETTDINLRDLAGEPYIMLDLPHSREYYLSVFNWAGVEPWVRYRVDSFESVRSFVGSGHGYTILHQGRGYSHTYSGGRVVSRGIKGNVPRLEIVIGATEEMLKTPRARAFSEIAKRVFETSPS